MLFIAVWGFFGIEIKMKCNKDIVFRNCYRSLATPFTTQ
jgi:hypothetical protein